MNRRNFLSSSVLVIAGVGTAAWLASPEIPDVAAKTAEEKDTITVVGFDDAGKNLGPSRVKKVHKTDAEWKQQLTPEQFEVARKGGMERAFTGIYAESTDKGLYRCICCGNALFSSRNEI